MDNMKPPRQFILFVFVILGMFLVSCKTRGQQEVISTSTPSPTGLIENISTNDWYSLLQITPSAFTTPLPDEAWTPIDGTYAKFDPSEPQWWACRRCADYRPAGGIWKLQFDKGIMRIY